MNAKDAENNEMQGIRLPLLVCNKGRQSELVFGPNETKHLNISGSEFIDELCINNGSTLGGRNNAFCQITGAHQKPCILISERTMDLYIPTMSHLNPECVWIYYNALVDYRNTGVRQTKCLFSNGYTCTIDCDIRSLRKQMERCEKFLDYLNDRNTVPETDSVYSLLKACSKK